MFHKRQEIVEEPEEELTILQRLVKLIFASTIKETLEEAEETYDGVCAKRKAQIEDILLHEGATLGVGAHVLGLLDVVHLPRQVDDSSSELQEGLILSRHSQNVTQRVNVSVSRRARDRGRNTNLIHCD